MKNALENTRSDDFDLDQQKDDESKIILMKYYMDKLQELRNEELSGKIKETDNITGRNIPKLENGQFDWKKRSEQALFKLKRASKIYEILSSRKFFLKITMRISKKIFITPPVKLKITNYTQRFMS